MKPRAFCIAPFLGGLASLWLAACSGGEPVSGTEDGGLGVGDVAVDQVAIADAMPADAKADVKVDAKADATTADLAGVKEACDNRLDDNGDGRVDEGCAASPNLRPDQAWQDLGFVAMPTGEEAAPTRTFQAAGKNQAMLLIGRDAEAVPAYVWAETIVSPLGIQVLSPKTWATSYNRAAPNAGESTALVGMSPQVSVPAGPWTFGFVRATKVPLEYKGTPSPGWLHLGVVSRADIAAPKPLVLDLDVWLVGGPETADVFGKSWQWQQMSAKVASIWKAAGVSLGTVLMLDMPKEEAKKYRYLDNVLVADATNELNSVYVAIGKLRPKSTAVTVVVVAGLLDSKGAGVASGVSQIGGVTGMAGSRLGGIAIAIDDKQWQEVAKAGPTSQGAGDIWGVVLAHEVGHFLGLWHTDEFDGTLHDTLQDTPPCEKAGATLTAEVCTAQAKYLMFWAPKGTKVSADQAVVVRRHPGLR